MNTRQRSSHPKYRHKNVDSTAAQHSPSEPTLDQLMQTTKITDLNDDCLERIFMLLDVENLLNVKLANKWLGPAADIVYKRKFGTYSVCLYSVHNPQNTSRAVASIICEDDNINITDFKVCLQFVRCFSAFITHLDLYYGRLESARYDYVHQYINRYCADSLIAFRIHCKPAFAIKNFEKPFVAVQTVQLYGCDLCEQCLPLAEWFPNVRELNINGFGLRHHLITAPPTQLEQVSFTMTDTKRGFILSLHGCIGNLVKSNRKLQKLTIKTFVQIAMTPLLNVIRKNRSDSKPGGASDTGATQPLLLQYTGIYSYGINLITYLFERIVR